MAWYKHQLFGWVGSGLLLGVSFIYPVVWILGLFGAVWFFSFVFTRRSDFGRDFLALGCQVR